jgi:hypothetical protein
VNLCLLPDRFAVCRLDADAELPSWASSPTFLSITRTHDELSIVCEEHRVTGDVRVVRGWRCIKVEGPIPFETTGVAASLTAPLGAAGISVFLIATFDTDYLLVQDNMLGAALDALREAGHVLSAEC